MSTISIKLPTERVTVKREAQVGGGMIKHDTPLPYKLLPPYRFNRRERAPTVA
jgi:hypothetical protein